MVLCSVSLGSFNGLTIAGKASDYSTGWSHRKETSAVIIVECASSLRNSECDMLARAYGAEFVIASILQMEG